MKSRCAESRSYRYNSLNQITEVTTPLGFKTIYSYDSLGNVLSITSPDPDGTGPLAAPIESFSYDNLGRTVSTTDPRGNVTAYAYDNLSRLISVTEPDPDGTGSQSPPVTSYGYNNRGFLTSVTDALGYVTAYTYDVAGQLTKVTEADPDGAGSLVSPVTSYTYDKLGQLTRITAPLSRLTNFSYDVGGRLTSVTDPLSHTTSYAYDALGRTTTITEPDPDGAAPAGPLPEPVTTLGYDARGSLTSRTDALGGVAAWNFDPMGRIVSETDEAGRTSQYGYDANSQLTTSKDPLLNVTSYQYDDDGRLTRVTQPDPDGNGALPAPDTRYGYDNLGRLSTQTDERGGISTFAYDLNGNLSSLTDPSGNATVYAYDNLDRLVSDTNALGDSRTYGYDPLGQLTTQTDRNGRVTNFTFDGLGRMTQEKWLVGSSTVNTLAYTYDAASRLTLASDSSSKYAYTYYASDRVKTVDNNGTPNVPRITLTSSYDNLDRRTQLTASAGAVADFKTNYQYDSLSRVTQITQSASGGAGGNAVAAKRIDFTYNAVGQYAQVNRFADLAGTQLVAGSVSGYDGAGRMTSLSHSKGSTTLNAYTWAYDPLGRPTQQTSADGTDTFSYDPASQVTGATHTSQANEAYAYDATGNRTNTGYTTGANNRLLSDGTYTYQYDAEGNRTRRTEIATEKYDVLAWDHHNRLTSVKSYTAAGVLTKQVQYTYDVYDRRIGRQVDVDGNGTWDSTRRFVYDGEDIVLAYSGSTAGSLTNRYLVGPNTDEILADETVVAGATSAVTWSLADNLGSVRDLVQYAAGTDTTTVVNHLLYDTFGQIKSQTNSAWQPLFAFTGREWDADAGLYFYRARWYDARVGRFLSEDPIGFAAGDVNLNRYVVNAPTLYVDPSGQLWGWIAAGVGAAGGAVTGAIVQTGVSIYNGRAPTIGELAGAVTAGAVTGGLVGGLGSGDPTVIGAIGIGAAAGAIGGVAGSAVQQKLDKGQIDAKELAASGVAGAVGGAIGAGVGRLIAKAASGAPGKAVTDAHGKIARYNRKLHYGGSQTNSHAGKVARAAAEGKPCPSCGETMTSGTPHAPIPQHDPPLVVHYYGFFGFLLSRAERIAYARSSNAISGALCRRCQCVEGAILVQYSREMAKRLGLL